MSSRTRAPLAFYCVSSELYFPGAVGLVNSLRRVGHAEPIYMLDCGITEAHRRAIEHEVTLVPAPEDAPPYLLKTIAPTLHPAEVMILIDADMVATRSLVPLAASAAKGRVVAAKDNLDRHDPRWGRALGLGEVRPRPYVSSGLVVLGGPAGRDVLELWHRHLPGLDYSRSYFAARDESYPFLYLDQDVLNAAIGARCGEGELDVLDARLAPHQPYRGLRVLSERDLRCAYRDGTEPFVIHQILEKPWLEPVYHSPYSRLLARLWLGDDVAVRLPPEEVPPRMRRGLAAWIRRKLVDAKDLARWYSRDVVPEWWAARRAQGQQGR